MEIMSFNVVIASWLLLHTLGYSIIELASIYCKRKKTNEVDTIAIHYTLHQITPKLGAKGRPQTIFRHKKINQLLLMFNVLV
jgi:hypothetical protein